LFFINCTAFIRKSKISEIKQYKGKIDLDDVREMRGSNLPDTPFSSSHID